MKKNFGLILATTLTMQFALAGQQAVVSTIGQSKTKGQVNRAVDVALSIPYFFTVPKSSYLDLSPELTSLRESQTEKLPLILLDYTKIDQEEDKSDESDLGLRLVLASGHDKRDKVSHKLASTGLVQTGDIILSARPRLTGTLPYIHVQLGVTHAGMALVKKDVDGKDYVYNVDMPLNSEMLGSNRQSKLTSEHYIDQSAIFHIVRPKNLTDAQRENVGAWLEIFRANSEKLYAPSPDPKKMVTAKVKNKISFNYDYMAPTYDATKKGEDELAFVADLGRLGLRAMGVKVEVPEGVSMFCSEFSWAVLSLKDCNPKDVQIQAQFVNQKTPSCVSKFFEPMNIFGSLYETQHYDDDDQFGMSDGPIVLVDVIKAGTKANSAGRSERDRLLQMNVFHKNEKVAAEMSNGHKAVEKALLEANPKFYEHVLGYYKLTALPELPQFNEYLMQRKGARDMFNASSKRNYSPTAMFMHALMPEVFDGKQMTQKSLDYVVTLMYLKADMKVKLGGQSVDAYQILLNTAKNTK